MRRNETHRLSRLAGLLLLALSVTGTSATTLSGVGDVEVHLNGGEDAAFIGETNTVEIWIMNDANLQGMSIGFEFSIGRAYEMNPTYGAFGYVNPEGDAVGSFNLAHGETALVDNSSPDSIMVWGSALDPPSGLPPHEIHALCYTLEVYVHPDQDALPGGFCIDNVLFPPAGTWTFVDDASYAPGFQGQPNSGEWEPDAPPVCFDILQPTLEPPLILNCPPDHIVDHCSPVVHYFQAIDPDGSGPLTWSASMGTIDSETGAWMLEYSTDPYADVFVSVMDGEGQTATCVFAVVFESESPELYGPCGQTLNAVPGLAMHADFDAVDDDFCDQPSFGLGSIYPDPNGIITIDAITGELEFIAADADIGTLFDVTVTVTDGLADESCDFAVLVTPEPEATCGDANGDGVVNISDAVHLIAYIFGGGPSPAPPEFGDANCDGIVNVSDAVYEIAYIFGGGPGPGDPDGNGAPDCLCTAGGCSVRISGPCCICESCSTTYYAYGNPGGGSFRWEITSGGTHATISGAANQSSVNVKGNSVSSSSEDVTLKVTYFVNDDSCVAEKKITVIDVSWDFRSSGRWSSDSGLDTLGGQYYGTPRLGPVVPESPDSCKVWGKSMELKGRLSPCDANLGNCIGSLDCSIDIKRERRGRVGVKPGSGSYQASAQDCPSSWCDDDPGDTDEDLTPSAAPNCNVFAIDVPCVVQYDCDSTNDGYYYINTQNFREWLEVEGQPCGDTVYWHASTVVRCAGDTLKLDSLQSGDDWFRNEIDSGHITIPGITKLRNSAVGRDDELLNQAWEFVNASLVLMLLTSESPGRRLTAEAIVEDLIEAGRLPDEVRAELIYELEKLLAGDGGTKAHDSAPQPAERLLKLLEKE